MTSTEALDAMLDVFKGGWDTARAGASWPVAYPNIGSTGFPPTSSTNWARVSIVHNDASASSFPSDGKRLHVLGGTLFVNIFTPSGITAVNGYNIAEVIADAFRRSSSNSDCWYSNVRIVEGGLDGNWWVTTVKVSFEYSKRI